MNIIIILVIILIIIFIIVPNFIAIEKETI